MRQAHHAVRGNVLFIILIAVALFGALTAAVTRSTSTVSPETLTEGQAKIYASEMMQYAHELEQAVNRLLTLKGCEQTQISFDENVSTVGTYDNAGAPSDYHCHVFHVNGGGVSYKPMNPEWLDKGASQTFYGQILFFTSCITGAGPQYVGNCNSGAPAVTQQYADIVLFIPFIKKEICTALVEKLMGSDTIPQDDTNAFGNAPYKGNFDSGTAHVDFTAPYAALQNATSGCFDGNGLGSSMPAGRYAFFSTLLIR